MDREQLRDLWERNKGRPQFVREHREAFAEHLSDTTTGHLPALDASTFEYRQFLNDYAEHVTADLFDVLGDDCTETVEDSGEECGRGVPCQYHGLSGVDFGETPTTDADETEA